METNAKEIENWKNLIEDGDWKVKEVWNTFSEYRMDITPRSIQMFLAWIVRQEVRDNIDMFKDWEDENPPRISKSSLPKMGVDGAGLKMISKLEKEKE